MPERPTEHPDFAMTDVTDPVSGQSNVVPPPEPTRDTGWTRYQKPPRQYLNWLHRLTAQWIRWLEGRVDELGNPSVTADPDTLILRDSAGRAEIAVPDAPADIANRWYVDREIGARVVRHFGESRSIGPVFDMPLTASHRAAITPASGRYGAMYDTESQTLRFLDFRVASGWSLNGSTPLTIAAAADAPVSMTTLRRAVAGGPFRVALARDVTVQRYDFASDTWTAVGGPYNPVDLTDLQVAALSSTDDTMAVLGRFGGFTVTLHTVTVSGGAITPVPGSYLTVLAGESLKNNLSIAALSATDVAVLVSEGSASSVLRRYRFDGSIWAPVGDWHETGIAGELPVRIAALSDREVAVTVPGGTAARLQVFRSTDTGWADAGAPLWNNGTLGSPVAVTALSGTSVAMVGPGSNPGGRIVGMDYTTLPAPYTP